jgi:hypothetical protein
MARHTLRRLTGYLGVTGLAIVAASCSSPAGTGNAGANLTMVLSWTPTGNMDVGATTPGTPPGVISANFPGNAANCTHSGDDQGASGGTETMGCNPAQIGQYDIVVENYSGNMIGYTLTVQVNGVNYSGFAPVTASAGPMTTLGNGTEIHHTFVLQ